MMAAPFLAFVFSMGFAWRGSSRLALAMFFVALGLSIGVFMSHIDTPLHLQF